MFNVDANAVKNLRDTNMYQVGLLIQIWYILMLSRDLWITSLVCKKGHADALLDIGLIHYFLSCLDTAILGGLIIWGTVTIDPSSVQQCKDLPKETGCEAFL